MAFNASSPLAPATISNILSMLTTTGMRHPGNEALSVKLRIEALLWELGSSLIGSVVYFSCRICQLNMP